MRLIGFFVIFIMLLQTSATFAYEKSIANIKEKIKQGMLLHGEYFGNKIIFKLNNTHNYPQYIKQEFISTINEYKSQLYRNEELGISFLLKSGFDINELITFNGNIMYGKSKLQKCFIKTHQHCDFLYSPYLIIFKGGNKNILEEINNYTEPYNLNITKFCELQSNGTYYGNSNFQSYRVHINKKLFQKKIDQFEKNVKNTGNIDHVIEQKILYNNFIVSKCSEFANPFNAGTSKSVMGSFLTKDNNMLFISGGYSPHVVDQSSITFLKNN